MIMKTRLHAMLVVGVLSAACALLSDGVANAQAPPVRTYTVVPTPGYTYQTYTYGGRTYYYYAPPRAYTVPVQATRRVNRSTWAPYHSSTYYDWSTSREVPMVKPWMRPYR